MMPESVRNELDEAIEGLRGVGPLTEDDMFEQMRVQSLEDRGKSLAAHRLTAKRVMELQDVRRVSDRKAKDFALVVHNFLAKRLGWARQRFRISRDEAKELWEARQAQICLDDSVLDSALAGILLLEKRKKEDFLRRQRILRNASLRFGSNWALVLARSS